MIRPIRLLNVVMGLWLLVAPWMLSTIVPLAVWNDMLAGAALIGLSLPRGTIQDRFGDWNRYLTW